jgi:hypothetical protein
VVPGDRSSTKEKRRDEIAEFVPDAQDNEAGSIPLGARPERIKKYDRIIK